MLPSNPILKSGINAFGRSVISAASTITNPIFNVITADSRSTQASKSLNVFPNSIEVDLEPIEIKKGVNLASTDPSFIVKLLGGFSSIPTMRKFIFASNYMVFGGILLENIIESNSTLISQMIKEAIDYLNMQASVNRDQKLEYLEAKTNYIKLIDYVESQRNYFVTKAKQSEATKKQFYKKIYEIISNESSFARALVTTIRAFFASYLLKRPNSSSNQDFIAQVLSDSFSFDEEYLVDACQLFADYFSYKVDLLEIDVRITAKETIKKNQFFPSTTNKEYSYSCGIVKVFEKNRKYLAIGYSLSPSVPRKSTEPKITNEKGAGIGFKSANATSKTSIENMAKIDENTATKKISDGSDMPSGSKAVDPARRKSESLITCDICKAPVNKLDIFENKFCNHRICIYCINDSELKVTRLCLLVQCKYRMDPDGIRKFVKEYDERTQKIQDNKTSAIEDSKTQDANSRPEFKQFSAKACDACAEKKVQGSFFTNHCGHQYCVDCINSKIDSKQKYCLTPSCARFLDSEEISKFIGQQMAEEILSVKITCRNCFRTNELHYQRSVKPEYYKCNKCNSMSCVKHNDLMSKCQCFCQVCLTALELNIKTLIKSCQRCKKNFCAECGERSTSNQICDCLCELCLDKKTQRQNKLCDGCISQPMYCPICLETFDDSNEYVQQCGHKICVKCRQDSLEEALAKQSPSKNCAICSKLSLINK